MPFTLLQSEFTYRSGVSPNLYQFTIVSDFVGNISVREIEDNYGQIVSPYTRIPKSVTDDISAAMSQVENLLNLTSVSNGTVSFSLESYKTVLFPTPLPNSSYRVQITSDIFAPFRVVSKTTSGFTIEAGATLTGNVSYEIFV